MKTACCNQVVVVTELVGNETQCNFCSALVWVVYQILVQNRFEELNMWQKERNNARHNTEYFNEGRFILHHSHCHIITIEIYWTQLLRDIHRSLAWINLSLDRKVPVTRYRTFSASPSHVSSTVVRSGHVWGWFPVFWYTRPWSRTTGVRTPRAAPVSAPCSPEGSHGASAAIHRTSVKRQKDSTGEMQMARKLPLSTPIFFRVWGMRFRDFRWKIHQILLLFAFN